MLIILYNFWVMYVLYRKYQEFVIVRQHYLVRGEQCYSLCGERAIASNCHMQARPKVEVRQMRLIEGCARRAVC